MTVYTRAYTPYGRVAHLIDEVDGSPNNGAASALCGRYPWPGAWWGTGTQDEYEAAEQMRTCRDCVRIEGYLQRYGHRFKGEC